MKEVMKDTLEKTYECYNCKRNLNLDEIWIIKEVGSDIYFCFDCYYQWKERRYFEDRKPWD